MDNLKETDKFLEKYNLPRLNQEKLENMNRLNDQEWNRVCNKKSPNKQKIPDQMASQVNSTKHLKKS